MGGPLRTLLPAGEERHGVSFVKEETKGRRMEKYLAIITETVRLGGVCLARLRWLGGTHNGCAVYHCLALATPCRRARTRAVRSLIDEANRQHGHLEVL